MSHRLSVISLLSVCFALHGTLLLAQQKGHAVADYPIDKLTPNIYLIHGPLTVPNVENQGFMNNPGIVLTSEGVVIVDPGGTLQAGEMVLRAVKKLSELPVIAVFNTHVHGDHWLGNQAVRNQYPQAKIYGHPNLIKRIAAGAGEEWLELMLRSTGGQSKGTQVVAADTAVNHGQTFRYGDTSFEIFNYGVAHTDTDIMIAVNKNEALFMGDNLFNGRLGRTLEGNIKGIIHSCEAVVATVQPQFIVPGHGQSGGLAMFDYAMDAVRILYATVQQQYQAGVSDYQMKPVVEAAMQDYKDWEEFDNLIGKLIGQAFLEIEAENF